MHFYNQRVNEGIHKFNIGPILPKRTIINSFCFNNFRLQLFVRVGMQCISFKLITFEGVMLQDVRRRRKMMNSNIKRVLSSFLTLSHFLPAH